MPDVSNNINNAESQVMPAIILSDAVLFPGCHHQIDVSGMTIISVLRNAASCNQGVFIVSSGEMDDAGLRLKNIGVVASITQILRHTEKNIVQIRVMAKYRAYAEMEASIGDVQTVRAIKADEISDDVGDYGAKRLYDEIFNEAIPNLNSLTTDKKLDMKFVMDDHNSGYGERVDRAAYIYPFVLSDKQDMLNCLSNKNRAELLLKALECEIEFIKLDEGIEKKTAKNMDESQREYYLREKIRVISEELGDGDSPEEEAEKYRRRIRELGLGEEAEKLLLREANKILKNPYGSQESAVTRGYLDVCLSVPWNVRTEDNLNISSVKKKLDEDHYGMTDVKERILELVAVRAMADDIRGQIICLVGSPGVGKTSIARSIAEAMGRKYVRVSLGGVRDEAEIRGHRKTYLGSMPGRIIDALIRAESMNPVILLDEIDKISSAYKGDPASALLETLDPEQNSSFVDHFMEIPVDLSEVLFITTANSVDSIPEALYDRMEIIEMPSYTYEEKLIIAKKYLIPKQMKKAGLSSSNLKISDAAVTKIIEEYTREAGVRELERKIATVCRKCTRKIVESDGEIDKVSVTGRNLDNYLGNPKFKRAEVQRKLKPGVANGLAWTSSGGDILEVEVAVMEGTGKMELTGKLGSVMQESAKAAVSCIRTRAADWGIDRDFYKDKDIHIHVPEGAVPKEGPSAGITMTTAIVSALTGVSVRGDVAMTGEITLGGRVLPIGGLREKSMAAFRNGIKNVIIPAENESDISEFPESVRTGVKFIPAALIDQVLDAALTEPVGGKAASNEI